MAEKQSIEKTILEIIDKLTLTSSHILLCICVCMCNAQHSTQTGSLTSDSSSSDSSGSEDDSDTSSSSSDDIQYPDGLDGELVGDEEDRQKLASMTEAEREQELFKRYKLIFVTIVIFGIQ